MTTTQSSERDDLVALLDKHRGLFLYTAQGLSDDQARATPTASELSVGGLIKHVSATVGQWLDFIEGQQSQGGDDAGDWGADSDAAVRAFLNGFRLLPDERLADVVATYERVTDRAIDLARTVDLDQAHPLPEAPWFEKGSWSNRRVLIHIVAETAQHAGHADIIRETIDGQKSMG